MTEEFKPPVDWSERHRTETLSRAEIEKLVQAVDALYFGGSQEANELQPPVDSDEMSN